jgi:YfiH family protein
MYPPIPVDLKFVRREVSYFVFPRLSSCRKLIHGIFSRHGGTSDPPFDTLNVSYSVGDSPGKVAENIKRIRKAIKAEDMAHVNQSHGDGIVVLGKDKFEKCLEVPFADAMITDVPRTALLVKQADCQGTIIYDPNRHIVANVHCGWRGNVRNILESVVIRMKEEFGCKESDLLAAIGPSLGPCCAEFIGYKSFFSGMFEQFMVRENHFDLWALSCRQLQGVGLREENIEVAGICTRCRTDLFYSYRGEGQTGRFGTVAMLLEP